MSSKNNASKGQKKHKKELKKKKRQALEIHKKKVWKEALRYPKFEVVTDTKIGTDADNLFIDAIYDATKLLCYDSSQGFDPAHELFFRVMAMRGYEFAIKRLDDGIVPTLEKMGPEKLKEIGASLDPSGYPAYGRHWISSSLEKALFSLMDPEIRTSLFPIHKFEVLPQGKVFYLWVRRLEEAKTPGGTVYYDPHSPEIFMEGEKRRIAFSKHALTRICDRLGPAWREDYPDSVAASAFCHRTKHAEVCHLYPNEISLSFFSSITVHFSTSFHTYIKGVLGDDRLRDELVTEYRIGYCPVVFHDNYVIAKTLLLPGYRGTPEFAALRNARNNRENVSSYFDLLENLDNQTLSTPEGIDLLKFFHKSGVAQVRCRKPENGEDADSKTVFVHKLKRGPL